MRNIHECMSVGSSVEVQCYRFAVVALDMISIPLSFLTNKIWRFADAWGSQHAPTTFQTKVTFQAATHIVFLTMRKFLLKLHYSIKKGIKEKQGRGDPDQHPGPRVCTVCTRTHARRHARSHQQNGGTNNVYKSLAHIGQYDDDE